MTAGVVSVEFARVARQLAEAARTGGWDPPAFRSPPRVEGVARTLRRRDGGAVVAVRAHGRPWLAVIADLIDGVVAANRLAGPDADRCRDHLWGALEGGVAAGRAA